MILANGSLSILISCLNFKNFTGSELYVYELGLALKRLGSDVSILSQIGGPLTKKAIENGLNVFSFQQPPNNLRFDIIHSQHFPVTESCLSIWPSIPHICSIHSEIIEMERPVIDHRVKMYVAVRPGIKELLSTKYYIPDERLTLIRNPVDGSRFNTRDTIRGGFVLFVGTIDYLREQAIRDLVEMTHAAGQELLLVGKNKSSYLEDVLSRPHVKYCPETDSVEQITKKCDVTAGIMLGRTTVEGWLCGKAGWIYDVDATGAINSKKLADPPADVEDYLSSNVANKMMGLYKQVLNSV